MAQSLPSISVIIPTLNGGDLFRELLEKISTQDITPEEILVVDSSSNDNTQIIAEEFGAKVISISRSEFDHGATRTMASLQTSGEILLFFTQDAIPVNQDLIRNLILPFAKDESIAISYGRQMPNGDATLSATALRFFNYPATSNIRKFSDKETLGLKTAFVSNSCAAYRRSSFEKVGCFPEKLIFGEDTCTAGRLLLKGYKIAYVAEAEVLHSHNYSLVEDFRRSFDIGVLHKIERWLPETFGFAEGEGLKYIKFELGMILSQKQIHLLPLFFCRNIMKFIGYKLGNKYAILPQSLVPYLSMNKNWWRKNTVL